MRTLQWGVVVAACAAALAGCGGSDSSSSSSSVTGVAATGAAISGGTVSFKCAGGTVASVTTGSDGSYIASLGSATLPCYIRVDYKDSTGAAQKLHSYVASAGTANVTPVTNLMVAKLAGGTASSAFDSFDASKIVKINTAAVTAAVDAVKTYLKSTLGVDTTNLPVDPIGTKFKAAVNGAGGDSLDKVLDDLASKLKTAGKSLSDVEKTVAASGTGSTGSTGTAGSAVGTGAYAGVKAADNTAFKSVVVAHCTQDTALTDSDHTVYKNCSQGTPSSIADNLTWMMYLGAFPNTTGTDIVSGPGSVASAAISASGYTGVTGVADNDSCKVALVEPVLPIAVVQVKGADFTQTGSNFNFRGTDKDTIYVSPGGVVMQYNMTDGSGNIMQISFNTKTGKSSASVYKSDSSKFITCVDAGYTY